MRRGPLRWRRHRRPVRVVIDDLRVMDFDACYFRSSAAAITGLAALARTQTPITQCWFDHDLGGDDTIGPVLNALEAWDFWGDRPWPRIEEAIIHTMNPVGATMIATVLARLPIPRVRSIPGAGGNP